MDILYRRNYTIQSFASGIFHVTFLRFANMNCMNTVFLFIAGQYPTVWIFHIWLIHLPVDEHVKCFQSLYIMNNAILLSPFSEFFVLAIVLLNSRISIWFSLYNFYIFRKYFIFEVIFVVFSLVFFFFFKCGLL